MSLDLIEMVSRRELTAEEAVEIMLLEDRLRMPLWVVLVQWLWEMLQRCLL